MERMPPHILSHIFSFIFSPKPDPAEWESLRQRIARFLSINKLFRYVMLHSRLVTMVGFSPYTQCPWLLTIITQTQLFSRSITFADLYFRSSDQAVHAIHVLGPYLVGTLVVRLFPDLMDGGFALVKNNEAQQSLAELSYTKEGVAPSLRHLVIVSCLPGVVSAIMSPSKRAPAASPNLYEGYKGEAAFPKLVSVTFADRRMRTDPRFPNPAYINSNTHPELTQVVHVKSPSVCDTIAPQDSAFQLVTVTVAALKTFNESTMMCPVCKKECTVVMHCQECNQGRVMHRRCASNPPPCCATPQLQFIGAASS